MSEMMKAARREGRALSVWRARHSEAARVCTSVMVSWSGSRRQSEREDGASGVHRSLR